MNATTLLKLFFLLAVITVISSSSFAQSTAINPDTRDEKPYIEVTGVSEQEVVPDEIFVKVVLRERNAAKDRVTVEMQEAKLKSTLKNLGIDLVNLTLTDANADYITVKRKTNEVITQKEYNIKVTSATVVGQLFQELDKLQINDAQITRVNHSKMDSLKKEARIKAVKAAKDKATYLLAAIGEQIGKPLMVQETENDFYQPQPMMFEMKRAANVVVADGALPPPMEDIQFQKIKVRASIYTRFAIK